MKKGARIILIAMALTILAANTFSYTQWTNTSQSILIPNGANGMEMCWHNLKDSISGNTITRGDTMYVECMHAANPDLARRLAAGIEQGLNEPSFINQVANREGKLINTDPNTEYIVTIVWCIQPSGQWYASHYKITGTASTSNAINSHWNKNTNTTTSYYQNSYTYSSQPATQISSSNAFSQYQNHTSHWNQSYNNTYYNQKSYTVQNPANNTQWNNYSNFNNYITQATANTYNYSNNWNSHNTYNSNWNQWHR